MSLTAKLVRISAAPCQGGSADPSAPPNHDKVCVTHDETIFDRFDRIFRLRDGRLASVSRQSGLLGRAKASASA